METKRIRSAGARIQLRIVIGQQRPERSPLPDRVALKIRALAELRKLSIRRADLGTLEVIHIEIRQQMQPGLELDDFNRRAAVVGNERFVARNDQQVEWIVVRPALTRREFRRFAGSPSPQRIER